jgi:hypothetical protein
MRKAAAILGLGMASAVASGCWSSTDEPAVTDQLLAPDATGWVGKSTTGTTGIQGQWHAFADTRFGARASDCRTTAFGECSIVDQPAPGSTYPPSAGLGMCTSGIIARWIASSNGLTPDYSPGWAGIVLELDMPDWPEPRASVDPSAGQPYDAVAHDVTGFAFDIDSEPAPGAGLLVTTMEPGESSPGSKPVFFGGAGFDASPVHAGHNEFAWSDVGPGSFDGTHLTRLGFLVSGNDSNAVIYDFCINNLTALRPSNDIHPQRASDDQLLVPNEQGFVARSTTGTTNIQGIWIAVTDGVSEKGVPPGGCLTAGYAAADCSAVSAPDPAADAFAPTKDLGMCTSGRVAKPALGPDGVTPDYSDIWGAVILFSLNIPDAGGLGSDGYDAGRYGVTGFAFDIDSEPAPDAPIRVELPTLTTLTTQAFWGGDTGYSSPVHAGHNEFRWADVGGPLWVTNPPRLDPGKLTQIGFHVPSNQTHAVSYSFCINNLTALRH